MRMPDALGLALLLYLLVLLPWMAWRSALRLRAARSGTERPGTPPLPSRSKIFAGTLLLLAMLFWMSWLTGRSFGFELFHLPSLGAREVLAGIGALALLFGLRWVNRAIRTEAERREMPVYALLPRTRSEYGMFALTAIAAGIAEEAAYRGVGMAVLTWSTGSALLSAAVLSVAFGLAHMTQEAKSVGIITLIAASMHALVAITGTLVIAMVVHVVYDLVSGYLGGRTAKRYEASRGFPPASATSASP